MVRMWIRSKGSRQVHSWRTSSTSNTQLGGIQETGGGKRSTPRTVAKSVSDHSFPRWILQTVHRKPTVREHIGNVTKFM